jgi:hypothetical protein
MVPRSLFGTFGGMGSLNDYYIQREMDLTSMRPTRQILFGGMDVSSCFEESWRTLLPITPWSGAEAIKRLKTADRCEKEAGGG